MSKRMTDEDKTTIIEAHKAKTKIAKIAEDSGWSQASVQNVISIWKAEQQAFSARDDIDTFVDFVIHSRFTDRKKLKLIKVLHEEEK